jgi:CubicO group peptidase (beta-lactamase class C family)
MESVHIFMKNHRDNIRQMKENFGMIISLEQQEAIKKLIDDAVSAGAFPCASVLAGTKDTILFEYRTGNKRVYPDAAPLDKDTLFDLASLTKVSATAPLAMVLTDKGILSLGDKVSDYLPQFSADHTKDIRIGHLLTHTAGLASYIPLYKHCKSSEEAFDLIAKEGVCHPTGEQVIYSDLGFILAGRILEIAGGDTLDNLCKKYLYEPMGMEQTFFNPESDNTASTEKKPTSTEYINGVVHDENARFFGGVSGHAGLFSNAEDIRKYAVMLLSKGKINGTRILSESAVSTMIRNYTRHLNEDRGIGWSVKTDRVPGTDSYAGAGGELTSVGSYGHTGFTGTSLWVDPHYGVYVICLTNRVHYGRENTKIIRFRRLLHNMIFAALEK